VADPEVAERLKQSYPESKHAVWHPSENGEQPDQIASLLKPSVVRGDFGESKARDFARAI